MKSKIVFLFAGLLIFSLAEAHGGHENGRFNTVCEGLVVKPSGRDSSYDLDIQEFAKEVFGPGGIAERLGYATPSNVLEFLTPEQMTMLTRLSRHAVEHWKDGATLAAGKQGGGKIYEFVWPGCPSCRSFYEDTTNRAQQISIMLHVAGHNDFSEHSPMSRFRGTDTIKESIALDEKMAKYARQVGRDKVDEFYQHILSLELMQDLPRGRYKSPEELLQKPVDNTPNFLQGFVAYIKKHGEPWQSDIAATFERMRRPMAAIPSTKIMNEGWATLSQYLLLEYAPARWQTSDYAIEMARLMKGVSSAPLIGPGQWNPYWLGLQAWRRLRERFNEKPEMKNLPKLDRDKKFVQYAHHLMSHMYDKVFLKEALDETWVIKKQLFLVRPAKDDEVDPNLPPSPDKEMKQQYIVISTKGEDVVAKIASEAADLSGKIPRIVFQNLPEVLNENEGVEITVDNPHRVPVKVSSIAPTLDVLSKLFKRPVKFKTLIAFKKIISEVEISMNKEGRIEIGKTIHAWSDSALITELNDSLKAYRDSAEPVYRSALVSAFDVPKQIRQTVVDHNLHVSALPNAELPNASKAILAYAAAMRKLLPQALSQMVQGNLDVRKSNTGVRFQILPTIPFFVFDHQAQAGAEDEEEAPKVSLLMGVEAPMAKKKDHPEKIAAGPKRKGDRMWGPKPEGGGGGGSQSDGQEGEGEEKEGQPSSGPSGDGRGSVVEVPFDAFFQMLSVAIELPNLRPRAGESEITEEDKGGAKYFPEGDELWDRIAEEAIPLGQRALRNKGEDPSDIRRAFIEGMKYLSSGDYVVKGELPRPTPVAKAVVVFQLDMSGSMDKLFPRIRDFAYAMKHLLQERYENIEFRYVGTSSEAKEFPEETFFKSFMSGGTNYNVGFRFIKNILDGYSPDQWDRYVFTFGDMDTSNVDETINEVNSLLRELQYIGFVYTINGSQTSDSEKFNRYASNLALHDDYAGYAILNEGLNGMIKALHDLFKTGKSK